MAVNQQQKNLMKRLVHDKHELEMQPVENVSATPLDKNPLEWHCNFNADDITYHFILFLTDKYPYESPSAEMVVPAGFRNNIDATMEGKKGTKMCLYIFSCWIPSYTVRNIIMSAVDFLTETQFGGSSWMELSKAYKCKDCSHTYEKPFPPMPKYKHKKTKDTKDTKDTKRPQIIDYISKEAFKADKPSSDAEIYGYVLIQSGSPLRPVLTTPCEFLQLGSFNGMSNAIGKVHSAMKEELKFFLPMYIHPQHGGEIKKTVENTFINEIAKVLPKWGNTKKTIEEMVIKTIPHLMSETVGEFSKGRQHTRYNTFNGYFALHRLFLWALETYPNLQELVDGRLKDFIDDKANRTIQTCPHIGEWLMLLSGCKKYSWAKAADAYISENWRRQVMWYVKNKPELGNQNMPQDSRLIKTFALTTINRKQLAFQVVFLDIAMPNMKTRKDLIKRYDDNFGLPTYDMMNQMKEAVKLINKMDSYSDWFKVLNMKPTTDTEIYDQLESAVEYAMQTDGYHLKAPVNSEIGWRGLKRAAEEPCEEAGQSGNKFRSMAY